MQKNYPVCIIYSHVNWMSHKHMAEKSLSAAGAGPVRGSSHVLGMQDPVQNF